ncbi:hypothetical protein HYV84_07015 [Candidatus Woesearchaeota archaeon]|nr:hypothetical protein [Candidatus Woesearchaeota archaeon]
MAGVGQMGNAGIAAEQMPQTEDDLVRELHRKMYANPIILPFKNALFLPIDSTTNSWESHIHYAARGPGEKPERQTQVMLGRRNVRRFFYEDVDQSNADRHAGAAASQLLTLGPLYRKNPGDPYQDGDMIFTPEGFKAYVSEMEQTLGFLSQFSDGQGVANLRKTIDDVKGMFQN